MARVPEILVIDQDLQARYEVKQIVRQSQLGFAGEAGLGTEGVSLASEKKPDVIVCGLSSPPERSLQTIEALLDVLPETPIIACAQREDVEAVRQAMQAGARDFLTLPIDPERFNASIRSVLEAEERKRLRLSGQAKGIGPKGLVIGVYGAKGGVGKTTLATNLGIGLAAKLNQSTVLIDADDTFGDVAAMLDVRQDRSIVDVVRDLGKIDRDNITDYLVKHPSGLWILPAPRQSLLWRSVTPDSMRKVIELLSRRFDIVLMDMAAGLSDLMMTTLEQANMVLWVTTTDFSSINNSLLGFEALAQIKYPEARVRLVLNVTTSDDGVRPVKIEEVLKRQFFWAIPYDRQVRMGAQLGNPAILATNESPGAKAILQLGQALTGATAVEQPKPTTIRGLFRRKEQQPRDAALNVEGS